jgi:methionyl-tRNA synthetase
MLKAHGGFVLPENVPANEFLNLEGDKISTSRDWAVWVHEYVQDFPGKEDVLRYVLTSTAPETKDNDFTWKDFQQRNNSELTDIFSNFVHRTMVLMHKLCGGKVPPFHLDVKDEADDAVLTDLLAAKEKIEESLENYRFREALAEVMNVARLGNQYLQKKEPWKLKPEEAHDRKVIDNCLHLCLQLTANLAIFVNPFMPGTAKKILHLLKVVDRMLEWENAGSLKLLSVGYALRAPEYLFTKIDDAVIKAQVDKLVEKKKAAEARAKAQAQAAGAKEPTPMKETIEYEDFAKLDLRVGTILEAEKVPKADKLLKLLVDIGSEKRTVVSGIAMHFAPEEIIGKQVTLVANLAPRKMRGIESQGMILMAEDAAGKLVFVNPDVETAAGSEVR